MSTGKGIGGREVPGAAFASDVNGKSNTRKKKRKGRKGRNAAAKSEVQSQNGEVLGQGAQVTSECLDQEADDAGSPHHEVDSLGNGVMENGAHADDLLDTNTPNILGEESSDGPHWTPQESTTEDDEPEKAAWVIEREEIETWFDAQTSLTYTNLSQDRRAKVIEHLTNHKYPQHDPEWATSTRLMIWRAVVRANYWWINPDTAEPTGKPKPVRIPDGVHEGKFEVFVMCCAEREDRQGRDLPDPEYVKQVQIEVRRFMKTVEKEVLQDRLKHLAFLLMFDEERRQNVLKPEDMQQRIRMAFSGANVDWSGNEVFKPSSEQQQPPAPGSNLAVADSIWRDAMAQL